jgi:hypothetical protein
MSSLDALNLEETSKARVAVAHKRERRTSVGKPDHESAPRQGTSRSMRRFMNYPYPEFIEIVDVLNIAKFIQPRSRERCHFR